MKKRIDIEKFPIKEIRLVEAQTKDENGIIDKHWDAIVLYAAEDAAGNQLYAKNIRLTLAKNISNQIIKSFGDAIDTFETNPSNPIL